MKKISAISWLDAVSYCNASSEWEGLMPVYTVDGNDVTWDRSAEESNYYGRYPYEIEDNYFSQGNLTTKSGEYRQTTVPVTSFSPNRWGLYNMHGNVSEWVWDYYGTYNSTNESTVGVEEQTDPTGVETGRCGCTGAAAGMILPKICAVLTARRLPWIKAVSTSAYALCGMQ